MHDCSLRQFILYLTMAYFCTILLLFYVLTNYEYMNCMRLIINLRNTLNLYKLLLIIGLCRGAIVQL